MNKFSSDETAFMNLRDKLATELEDITHQMDQLEARRIHLEGILNGSTANPAISEVEEEPEGEEELEETLDDMIYKFLAKKPGAQRVLLNDAFPAEPKQIELALKRLKRKGLVHAEGKARGTQWFAVK